MKINGILFFINPQKVMIKKGENTKTGQKKRKDTANFEKRTTS